VPPLRPSTSLPAGSTTSHTHSHSHSHHHHHFDPSSSSSVPLGSAIGAGGTPSAGRPTPNRFPEQVEEDDPLLVSQLSESSSSDEDRDLDDAGAVADLEIGSDWGGASATGGYETGPEDGGGGALEEARKIQNLWQGIRSGGGSKASVSAHTSNATSMAKSPGSGGSRGMDLEVSLKFLNSRQRDQFSHSFGTSRTLSTYLRRRVLHTLLDPESGKVSFISLCLRRTLVYDLHLSQILKIVSSLIQRL
jgi:hypothetical protein